MKNQIRLALLCMAATAAPVYAQSGSPLCGASNYDPSRNAYMIMNPAAGAVNQQCFITVYPTGAAPAAARQYPASYLIEGSYSVELSGGGGGGGGGAKKDAGGGGGGAGAAPSRTVRFLAPGEYKLTIGTGGAGGSTSTSTRSLNGNPTSIVNARTGQLIAGFANADRAVATSSTGSAGKGGVGAPGGSTGGSGGDSGMRAEAPAQSGSASASGGTSSGGRAGTEGGRTDQANAGGGGGAGVGSGGAGSSVGGTGSAVGAMGAGGGGGAGGVRSVDMGSRGGNGFVRLSLMALAPVAAVAAPAAGKPAPVQKYTLSSDALFSFGKTTLRPEGEAKLDELVAKLKSVDIDTVLSTGHTDRIGSSAQNLKLSIDRAEVVKAYLVSKGVQSYRNAAVGMGGSQPVTAAGDCKGATNPKIIGCLQPDRRVDVEVVVSNKI